MAMTACVQQEEIKDSSLGKNDFAFSVGKIDTRSAEYNAEEVSTLTIPVGTFNGESFFLEETVTDLDYDLIETKGTPIYTQNIDTYYKNINVVGYSTVDDGTILVPDTAYGFEFENGGRKVYTHYFGQDLWPDDADEDVYFFLKAPADYISSNTSKLTHNPSDGSIEFDYTSPYTGELQKDMLFTSRTLTKNEYTNNYSANGAPVTLYHALTGVKFRVGSDNTGTTKTIITGVKFSGLNDFGHCVITPTEGKVSKENVHWSKQDTELGTFTQGFDNTSYDDMGQAGGTKPIDNSIDLTNNENFAGTSLVKAASDQQLNDEDGSLTFWFIPQVITDAVTLEVTFRVKTGDTKEGTEITHVINFGEQLVAAGGANWLPGQLRTYTLDPKDVDVDIFDQMTGYVKNNLHVTNTGNVDEYVRMMLMGNWYGWLPDQDPTKVPASMLVGYTSEDTSDETMVDNWFGRKEPYSRGFDETFTGGKPNADEGNPWLFGTGSYYYYPTPIGAGEKLAETATLFQSYTLDPAWIPDIYIPVGGTRQKAKGVHLVFECVVQAIGAEDSNGHSYADCWAAWSAATGETIGPKNN